MADHIRSTLPQQASIVAPPHSPPVPSATPKTIALITCSTRPNRINPTITAYITSLLGLSLPSSLTLTTIDLKPLDLPLFNEPTIPAALDKTNPTPGYITPHAQSWSAEIAKHSAFIFVTPQYNWSMPASIKNALDYLYHEWTGKPAFVVSYGGHGGGKSRAALENVLMSLKMRVVGGVEITIKVQEGFALGEKEGEEEVKLVPEGMQGRWKEQGVEEGVGRAWTELLKLLQDE